MYMLRLGLWQLHFATLLADQLVSLAGVYFILYCVVQINK